MHIRCAEQQARAAARRRAVRAAVSAVVLLGIEVGVLRTVGGDLEAVRLAVLLIAAHVLINRRWLS